MFENKLNLNFEGGLNNNIITTSDFDSGSIYSIDYIKYQNTFDCCVSSDLDYKNNKAGISSWFYFKIWNLEKNKKCKFIIRNIGILKQIVF